MTELERIRRRRLLSEAEGYLELILGFTWSPDEKSRDALAQRALIALSRLAGEKWRRPHILYLQGQAFRAMERYAEALIPLEQARQLTPENTHIHLAMAWCNKRSGQVAEAIGNLEEAVEAEPDKAILHYNLACYYSLAMAPEAAIYHLEIALELDPSYRDAAGSEPDFDPIRHHPDFRLITSVVV